MDRRQALYLAAGGLAASCSKTKRITVGSKNFTEQDILGEILLRHVARQIGVEPVARLHLGGSFIAHQALVDGAIDLYPEYSGTALSMCLKLPLLRDSEAVFKQVKQAYAERHQVEWGWPLGFSNSFAMVARRADVSALSKPALSAAVENGRKWRVGAGYEFTQRADGWTAFQKVYPIELGGAVRTMGLGLMYRALASNDVDLIAGNSTDPNLASGEFVALEDDLHFFPPYETCLAVRSDALISFPALRSALDKLTGSIPVAQMRNWNAQVVIEKVSPAAIASAFVSTL